VAATLSAAAPAVAAPPDSTPALQFENGNYVVTLVEPPAATYDGGTAGIPATKPGKGQQLKADKAEVKRYRAHLKEQQKKVAAAVDAEPKYSYTAAVNGFSAKLTATQAAKLATVKGVLAVTPDEQRHLDTVSSPEFLGLTGKDGTWKALGGPKGAGKGVVVGIVDSGITPENPSFAGHTLRGAPDKKDPNRPWRKGDDVYMKKADGGTFQGTCETGEDFKKNDCNEKLISARYFSDGFVASVPPEDRSPYEHISPRDGDGHGTHTAGTAVGNHGVRMTVDNRDFGKGSGMAPAAKLAVYKVCWEDNDPDTGGCYTSDSVAAIDQAVLDGVDVINYSISGATDTVFDPVELAFMSAASAGVFVAASAGNEGPGASTVAHNSPWLTTVAASTHVNYEGTVVLGNGDKYRGASISDTGVPNQTPAVLSSEAGIEPTDDIGETEIALCAPNSLDPAKAGGKIVVCDRGVYDRVAKSAEVARAGGVGMVLANVTPGSLDADFHSVPTVHVDEKAGAKIKSYVGDTDGATAALLPGDQTGLAPTPKPVIAGFSSRGPALANGGDLLKPDISAPGVSVLAAVAPGPDGGRNFDVKSGTSMSSPHIAGLAALIFTKYPTWTPMQVKSAMMTTAYDLKNPDGTADRDVFHAGAGHVDPTRFLNPGLVYDSGVEEWLRFIEGTGTDTGIPGIEPMDPSDLNQPSIAIGQLAGPQTVTRKVTAVTGGLYRAKVDMPGMKVDVTPSVLNMQPGQTKEFRVTFTRTKAPLGEWAKGFLTWGGGNTTVRSPLAVKPVSVAAPAEVSGQVSDGSVSWQVTPGTDEAIDLAVHGLVPGTVKDDTVAVGPVDLGGNASTKAYDFEVPEGTTLARFDLVAGDQGDDLDLYVVNPEFTAFVPSQNAGATSGASERIDLVDPEPGTYHVFVNGYATTDGQPAEFSLRMFAAGGDAGNATVSPDPLEGRQGVPATVTLSYDGLESGTPYLGWVGYEGAEQRTVVTLESGDSAGAPGDSAGESAPKVTAPDKGVSSAPVMPKDSAGRG
jgi:subtilisin family serine protease